MKTNTLKPRRIKNSKTNGVNDVLKNQMQMISYPILRAVSTFLLLLVMVMGCQKKDTYDPKSIIGKWQNIQYPENCVGFGDRMIEITADSLFKLYVDGELDFTSTFNIKTGGMGYDTIFYHDHTGYYNWGLVTMKSSDTLHLVPPIFTLTGICDYYRRKN